MTTKLFGELRHPNIGDRAKHLVSGDIAPIIEFHRVDTIPAHNASGAPLVRTMRICHSNDPDACLVTLDLHNRSFYWLWEIEWFSLPNWTANTTELELEKYRGSVENFDPHFAMTSEHYPYYFAKFPALSHHDRIKIAKWRSQTSKLILAEEKVKQSIAHRRL